MKEITSDLLNNLESVFVTKEALAESVRKENQAKKDVAQAASESVEAQEYLIKTMGGRKQVIAKYADKLWKITGTNTTNLKIEEIKIDIE